LCYFYCKSIGILITLRYFTILYRLYRQKNSRYRPLSRAFFQPSMLLLSAPCTADHNRAVYRNEKFVTSQYDNDVVISIGPPLQCHWHCATMLHHSTADGGWDFVKLELTVGSGCGLDKSNPRLPILISPNLTKSPFSLLS
jgi:hypothetical protein